MTQTINTLLGKIVTLIVNPIIILGFVVATIYLFYGIIEMIRQADAKDDKAKQNVMYGVIGLFIMFSVYGILRLVTASLQLDCNLFFC